MLEQVLRIVNEPGMTWKVRRALLRALGLDEQTIKQLIPEPPNGMEHWPGDY